MAYATLSDAIAYLGVLGNTLPVAGLHPNQTDVNQYLTDRSNQIDAALKSRGLSVPVATPAEFVAELVALNAKGAAGDAMTAAYITNDSNDRGAGATYLKEFLARINQFYQGVGVPVGAAVAEADLAPASPWSGPYARPARRIFPNGLFE